MHLFLDMTQKELLLRPGVLTTIFNKYIFFPNKTLLGSFVYKMAGSDEASTRSHAESSAEGTLSLSRSITTCPRV